MKQLFIVFSLLIIGLIFFFYSLDRDKLLRDRKGTERTAVPLVRLLDSDEFIEQCRNAFTSLPSFHQELIAEIINDERELQGFTRAFPQEIIFPMSKNQDSLSLKTMDAVYLTSRSRIAASIEIPQDALLEFSYSFPRLKPGSGSELLVTCRDKDTEHLLFQNTIQISGRFLHRWYDIQVPIHNRGRCEVVIEFNVPQTTPEAIEFILGNPVFYSSHSTIARHSGPNIILISLDAFRADHMSCYGYHRQTTPVMDRLSKQSSLFAEAFSQSGFTLPSHKSLLTGFYPQLFDYHSNSRFSNRKKLLGGIPLVTAALKAKGYYTAAFTGGGFMSRTFGFCRDFDMYNEQLLEPSAMKPGIDGRITKESGFLPLIDWLRNSQSTPFFLFFHTYGIHSPYAAPREYDSLFKTALSTSLPATISSKYLGDYNMDSENRGRSYPAGNLSHIINCYDRGIRWIDNEIGHLLAALDELSLLETTIVIITSDHGEEFLEHGLFEHGMLYKQTLHVPLIIRYPRSDPHGSIVRKSIELIHLVPTLHDMIGYRPTRLFPGESLLPLLSGKKSTSWQKERPIFASQTSWVAVQFKDYKYHFRQKPELYNVSEDPLELDNLWTSHKNPPEMQDLLYRALYYIAENHPGYNILLTENENILNITLNDVPLTRNATFNKGNKYIFENDDAGIYVNYCAAQNIKTPALFTFEASCDDGYILQFEVKKEPEIPERFASGFRRVKTHDYIYAPQATIISKEVSGAQKQKTRILLVEDCRSSTQCPPVHKGLRLNDLTHYDGFIWKTDLGFQNTEATPADVIDQTMINSLEAIGYIQ